MTTQWLFIQIKAILRRKKIIQSKTQQTGRSQGCALRKILKQAKDFEPVKSSVPSMWFFMKKLRFLTVVNKTQKYGKLPGATQGTARAQSCMALEKSTVHQTCFSLITPGVSYSQVCFLLGWSITKLGWTTVIPEDLLSGSEGTRACRCFLLFFPRSL